MKCKSRLKLDSPQSTAHGHGGTRLARKLSNKQGRESNYRHQSQCDDTHPQPRIENGRMASIQSRNIGCCFSTPVLISSFMPNSQWLVKVAQAQTLNSRPPVLRGWWPYKHLVPFNGCNASFSHAPMIPLPPAKLIHCAIQFASQIPPCNQAKPRGIFQQA